MPILLRADSGFCREALMTWCETHRVDFVLGLAHTPFAEATAGTNRLKLLKIGALVTISVRRIRIAMASGCPWQAEWALAHARLRNAAA